ncbi:MAG: hypothetical protein WBD46_00065 [Acidobacteriaceae bacterium]
MGLCFENLRRSLWQRRSVPFRCSAAAARDVFAFYDTYGREYRTWAPERPYYNQWEHGTHRDHMDYDHRNDADKQAYRQWRHSHDRDQH